MLTILIVNSTAQLNTKHPQKAKDYLHKQNNGLGSLCFTRQSIFSLTLSKVSSVLGSNL